MSGCSPSRVKILFTDFTDLHRFLVLSEFVGCGYMVGLALCLPRRGQTQRLPYRWCQPPEIPKTQIFFLIRIHPC